MGYDGALHTLHSDDTTTRRPQAAQRGGRTLPPPGPLGSQHLP
jgi:hypothetical protein